MEDSPTKQINYRKKEIIPIFRRKRERFMKDEFTTAMHKEFSISSEIEIKHRAGCVWSILEFKNPTREEIIKRCKSYDISYEDALKWKDYWMNLQRVSQKFNQ